jgi:lipopolysaccharide export system permease protein
MNTISRYFLSVYLANFVRVIIGLTLVIILIDTVEISRRASSIVDFTIFDIAALAALRAPSFLETNVPFVVLFSAMMTLLALNKRQELVITRASGMSAWQFIAPLCVGSVLIGIVAVCFFNPLATLSVKKADDIQIKIGLLAPKGGNIVPWFRQITEDGILVVGAAQASSSGTRLGQPSFFFFDANNNPVKRVDAETGALVDGNWVLQKASIYKLGTDTEQVAEFVTPASIDKNLLGQTLSPPETISFFGLSSSIESARAFGLPDAPYAMRWHSLFALPALLVAMTLIAATVSLRFARFGQSSGAILGGVLAGFLLYVVTAMAKALGGSGVVAPVISAWLPVIAASFFGVTFLLHREDG